ncbi:MerR family transcriptional regulator [Paraburkholderia bryophila]|uniref:DNA-binding transcriptional MerR regulator n=1 Tax=Paraburkholderia bryophila TaxID=420952 RepID=A0A7Z0AYP3_9BURK|nr:MerR family transcriptional regulator [Paraburkholderia bryophila]NYH14841.1 DNA-binding transcriptional MerR regulator [Paraburkholderia bryophila]
MSSSAPCLNASEAASQLGVSIKALRLYEQQGLVTPGRTAAGYRVYGPNEMDRAGEIVALRALGPSLAQVARVLDGDPQSLATALAAHETALNEELQDLVQKLDRIRRVRSDLARGQMPIDGELTRLVDRPGISVEFALPWPWGGERFELRDICPLNYIIGSLGSGKTRLALRLAETLPDAEFLGLDRLQDKGAAALDLLKADAALKSRVDRAVEWLIDEGATESEALTILLVGLEADGPAALVVDMVEQDLDGVTQEALITFLRLRASAGVRPLFLMTRSSAILDLAAVGPDEAIILCPANHSAPVRVAPYPGAPGYEAVATCLATPEVRARIAHRPETTAGEATIYTPQTHAARDS